MPLTFELDHAICKCQLWNIHCSVVFTVPFYNCYYYCYYFPFLPGDWMFGDCGRRGLYIWKASDLTPEVISPGQLKVHVCFQQQLCKLLLPRLCRAYVKIPQRQCPLCEPVALLIPGNSNPSFKRNGPKMALPPQTDVFQPLSKAAFISSWKGKHHNLGSHVSCLSVRHCQLFLQHPRVLWQSREQVTHLSKGCSERYHSVRSSELQASVLSLIAFFLNGLEIKYHCVYYTVFSTAHWFSLLPIASRTCPTHCKNCVAGSVLELFSWCCGMWVDQMYHENNLSHQQPTAEQNYTYCKRSQISLTDFSSFPLLLFYIEIESGQFI